MLYDLNISWSPSIPAAELERTLKFGAELGYNVVALNQTLSSPIPHQVVNPIPILGQTSSYHPEPRRTPKQSQDATTQPSLRKDLPTILRRATVLFADPATNYRFPTVAAAYDIVAVRPTTEKAFNAACLSVLDASLISLDLTMDYHFFFKPKPCMAAVRRGARFELCYGQTLDPGADARRRANFVGNLMGIVRATRGRGIVVSSEAKSALELRAPADVVNLMAVWGLKTEKATEAIGINPRGVVVNEGLKRRSFRGVIDIVKAADKPEEEHTEGAKAQEASQGEKGRREKGGKKGNQMTSDAAGKRKREELSTGKAADAPDLSKRQAKKLRAAEGRASETASDPA
jgi:ribonuclease P/MRP protein subunit RPP1